MKYLSYILILALSVLSISCTKEMDKGTDVPEGMVEVRIDIPEYYSDLRTRTQTKSDSESLAPYDELVKRLPVGATIWLSYSKKVGEDMYEDPMVKPYVLKSTDDYVGLFPCGMEEYTDSDGEEWLRVNSEIDQAPLFLEQGCTYKFKSMYPAHDIRKEDHVVNMHNGIWACTNDPRYAQTAGKEVTLETGLKKITYVELAPMINQTARLHFEISKGKNVHTIEMMRTGIEISGVQDKGTTTPLDWTMEDCIEVKQLESIEEGEHWYKLHEFEMENDKIIADAYILPLDVRRTYIFILFNMAVNGIPTQYVATLNGIILEHARSYNFELEAGVDGNLTVVNWQNTSLTIVPQKKNP